MYPDGSIEISIIIPAYNEEARLPTCLQATVDYFLAMGKTFEVIVVDDGSKDNTKAVVDLFCKKYPDANLRTIDYGANRGKGCAVRYGMLAARGELRLFCDADLATPIEEYAVVVRAMDAQDTPIGIGSRPLKTSKLLVHEPWYREALGRIFNKIVQHMAVSGIEDTQCGFKIFTACAAESIFSLCKIDGFAFDTEVLFLAQKLGFEVAEVPIRWAHKEGSKVSMVRDGLGMLCELSTVRYLHRSVQALDTESVNSSAR